MKEFFIERKRDTRASARTPVELKNRLLIRIGGLSSIALLVDINREGGMGIFVSDSSDLMQAKVNCLLEPWDIRRTSAINDAQFTARPLYLRRTVHNHVTGLRLGIKPRQAHSMLNKYDLRLMKKPESAMLVHADIGTKMIMGMIYDKCLDSGEHQALVVYKPEAQESLTLLDIFTGVWNLPLNPEIESGTIDYVMLLRHDDLLLRVRSRSQIATAAESAPAESAPDAAAVIGEAE